MVNSEDPIFSILISTGGLFDESEFEESIAKGVSFVELIFSTLILICSLDDGGGLFVDMVLGLGLCELFIDDLSEW